MSWQDIERNQTYRAMMRVIELTDLVSLGKKPFQMFCSLPGLGKTEWVLDTLAKNNIVPHYPGPATVHGYCADLWQCKNGLFFLDDWDRLARDEGLANIAKMVYGPQKLVIVPNSLRIQRNESWRVEGDFRYDPNIPPPTFNLGPRHGAIWNSNKNFSDPDVVRRGMQADFAALVSRGLDPLWISCDPQSVLDYTIWMIAGYGMLRRHPQQDRRGDRGGFKLIHQQEVLEFICQNARRLKEISPRMAHKLAMARRNDPHYEAAWKDQLADQILHPNLILPESTPLLISPAMKKKAAASPAPEPDTDPPASPSSPDLAPASDSTLAMVQPDSPRSTLASTKVTALPQSALQPGESQSASSSDPGAVERLQARAITAERLGDIHEDDVERLMPEAEQWEQATAGQFALSSFRGKRALTEMARAYRMRFAKAVASLHAQLSVDVAEGDLATAFAVRSAKWWVERGGESVDYIIAAAREHMAQRNNPPAERPDTPTIDATPLQRDPSDEV